MFSCISKSLVDARMFIDDFKEVFALHKRDREFLLAYGKENASKFVREIGDLIDGIGESCRTVSRLVSGLIQQSKALERAMAFKDQIKYKQWHDLVEKQLEMCELMGFVLLLRMDALFQLKELLSARAETEKIVACKHSYTIIAEARNKDLFSVISKKMRNFPEFVFKRNEYDALWKENKLLLKYITKKSKANLIRNSIDAHKLSFSEQMKAYGSMDYLQCLLDMFFLIIITQNIDGRLREINVRIGRLLSPFEKEELSYLVKQGLNTS